MNNLDKQYTNLLQDILDNGVTKSDRTGTGTISIFGRQIRHKMSDGFPLLTTKKMPFKTIVTELLWFLKGDTNIKYLVDNGCHIWDGDAYKNYLGKRTSANRDNINEPHTLANGMVGKVSRPYTQEEFINKIKTDDEFAKKWGELGPIYGKQWRSWGSIEETKTVRKKILDQENLEADIFYEQIVNKIGGIDQIANSIHLLKTDPDSRRNKVNSWNVGELDQMTLPPCHTDFQFYTRELSRDERCDIAEHYGYDSRKLAKPTAKQLDEANIPTRAISLMWNQRSVDTFLGLPFNIASYGLLLEIIAKAVNMVPDELIGNLGDVHLYSNHIEQAKEQIGREMTLSERTTYGINVLGYDGLLDYGHSQNDDDKILEFLEMIRLDVPTRTREPYPLPTLNIKLHFNNEPSFVPEHWLINDFEIEGYQSHPTIKAPLSN
jgi:thymidylate synthase